MDDAIITRPRRGRPPGRSAYQEERRRQTRATILDAAAELFAVTPYVYATIDDIIRAAKISRATFYDHFESKFALAIAIYDGIATDWIGHFDRLAALDPAKGEQLSEWIAALAQLYVAHGYVTPLVEQLAIFEQNFRLRLDQDRDVLIDRLAAAGLRGFSAAVGADGPARFQRARLRLLLFRLDQVCGMLSRPGGIPSEDADAYIAILAEELGQRLSE